MPTYGCADTLNLVQALDVLAAPSARPQVTSLRTWQRTGPVLFGMRPWLPTRDMADCLRPGETLAGPDGAPVEFLTDSGSGIQLSAVVVFRVDGQSIVPTGIVRGFCDAADWGGGVAAAPELRRYDLPQSGATGTWTLLRPIPHPDANRAVLMGHVPPGSDVLELVSVDLLGERKVVGELPADAEVVLSGTTHGQLG